MAQTISMDVFKQDAFSAQNLTAGIDRAGFIPTLLGTIPGLFVPPPLGQPSSKAIFVEERDNEPVLIQTSPRGSEPGVGRTDEKTRKVRPFMIPRLFKKRTIVASEIAGIREFGSVTVQQSLDSMIQRRQFQIQQDLSLTWENMRLGAVQGSVLDADGSTIYNYATEFGQTIPVEVTWTLATADDGSVRTAATTAKRSILRALKGQGGTGVSIYGLCSDTFWDALTSCTEVRKTFQAQEALQLQSDVTWQTFRYGGVTFVNYRGSDDNSTVAVADKKCKFFPAGAGIFQAVYGPADERFEFVNTPGQEAYSWMVVDPLRNMWADVEMTSYPLFMCTQPNALYRAKIN